MSTAPRGGTLIRFWCPSETEPMAGYWSRNFIGWCADAEDVPPPDSGHRRTACAARSETPRAVLSTIAWADASAPVFVIVDGHPIASLTEARQMVVSHIWPLEKQPALVRSCYHARITRYARA